MVWIFGGQFLFTLLGAPMERRSIAITGQIQGVGFRPFIHGLASRLKLVGSVRNHTGGVAIEIEGDSRRIDEFLELVRFRPPPLARIDLITCTPSTLRGGNHFCIEPSTNEPSGSIVIAPDAATCDQCLAELFDAANRRYRYPFLNCTNCGPRLTIITAAPYDRSRTSMSNFAMCAACRAEYEEPTNRRFHAQPTACAACGPHLAALSPDGELLAQGDEAARRAVAFLQAEKIVAVKGLGGYHLACDAASTHAVASLRKRKHRDEKPFAIMVRNLDAAKEICEVSNAEEALLMSSARPIVLLRRRFGARGIADGVAPGNPCLGIMLPYTPLHHLLLHDLGPGAVLVMTSGNHAAEPIACEDEDARERLAGIADIFLAHDRRITVRCDDSVVRVVDVQPAVIRRSRGYAPRPIALPFACDESVLAVGGHLKATFALGEDRRAVLSHHAGDLDDFESYRAFTRDIDLYENLFRASPVLIAHDMHPDYASTRYARGRAAKARGLQLQPVQHHHAHLASCMADCGLTGSVIGVIFDGTGYGEDGNIWGGEFLTGGYHAFSRAAHLRYVGMPGGDHAIREPWRMALSYLTDAGLGDEPLRGAVALDALRTARRMLERGVNAPLTSSAGRLFDAVASLTGIRQHVTYEGQAAVELEWLATGISAQGIYPHEIETNFGGCQVIDCRSMIQSIANDVSCGTDAAVMARRFHMTIVDVIVRTCDRIREQTLLNRVVLSGGVFMNALLASETSRGLGILGFDVFRHRNVPANDGGLSLGQIAVAAARIASPPPLTMESS